MKVAAVGDGTDLDAGNNLESERRGFGTRLVDAGDRVVIGDADDGQAGSVSGADQLGRRQASVGGGGVKVKIDHEWPLDAATMSA